MNGGTASKPPHLVGEAGEITSYAVITQPDRVSAGNDRTYDDDLEFSYENLEISISGAGSIEGKKAGLAEVTLRGLKKAKAQAQALKESTRAEA